MKIICLIVILLTFFYSLFIDIIDLKSSNNKIHEKVSDIYDEEKYKKWKNYKKDGVVLSIVSSIVQFIVTMVFLVFDIYALVGNSVGNNVYIQTLVTISLYIVIDFIISTVISYIDTMVIEEKYGFNNKNLNYL